MCVSTKGNKESLTLYSTYQTSQPAIATQLACSLLVTKRFLYSLLVTKYERADHGAEVKCATLMMLSVIERPSAFANFSG